MKCIRTSIRLIKTLDSRNPLRSRETVVVYKKPRTCEIPKEIVLRNPIVPIGTG